MGRRLTLKAHLGSDELERRDRQARDPVSRDQWQALWLLARGEPTATVARLTG